MPSADWEVWNTLTANAKFLRLFKYCAWSGAICSSSTQARRFLKKGNIMSVVFHWELVSDCPFGLPKISVGMHMHTHSE